MFVDGGVEIVEGEAEFLGFHGQLFHLAAQQASARVARAGRRLEHYRADARPHFEQSFGGQLGDHLVGGIGMNLHGLAQGANGGKGIAGAKLAGDHGLLRGESHLFVYRDAGLKGEAKGNQGSPPRLPAMS